MGTNDERSGTQAPPNLWEQQSGVVPTVKPEDLKSVWQLFADSEARNPGQSVAIGDSVFKSVCSPGADVFSVWYRVSILAAVIRMRPDLLSDVQRNDSVFEVAATFPMEKMQVGVARNGLPFDVEEFVKRIEQP
jgi:hypothetical protein